ncbi:MAG: type 1 glutamine amidotransferase [Pseudomonadota bacterium]
MRLLIAETGRPPAEIAGDWPSYATMFETMFRGASARFTCETITVMEGASVPEPQRGDALLVTGSPKGVYEGDDFIAPLEEAVRHYANTGAPVVGICFGHQLIARAFGARVEKADAGWGVGVHTYEVVGDAPWGEGPSRFACAVSHQDQVLSLPEGFRRVAASAFTPFGALAHETLPVLSFQMHPEFDHDFASALMDIRSDRIPAERAELGQMTLRNSSDRSLMASWITRFIKERLG